MRRKIAHPLYYLNQLEEFIWGAADSQVSWIREARKQIEKTGKIQPIRGIPWYPKYLMDLAKKYLGHNLYRKFRQSLKETGAVL